MSTGPGGHLAGQTRVAAVRGAVVDVRFDAPPLPPVAQALQVGWDRPQPLLLEVQAQLDAHTVRTVALQTPRAWPATWRCTTPAMRWRCRWARPCWAG